MITEIGYALAAVYLVPAALFDVRSRGTDVPDAYLKAWLAVAIGYFAVVMTFATPPFLELVVWLMSVVAMAVLVLFFLRTHFLGDADLFAFGTVVLLASMVSVQALIVGAVAELVTGFAFVLAINLRRREKLKFPDALLAVRLTPRLQRLPGLSWTPAYTPDGKLSGLINIQEVDLEEVKVGEYSMPAIPYIPMYAAAYVCLVAAQALGLIVLPII